MNGAMTSAFGRLRSPGRPAQPAHHLLDQAPPTQLVVVGSRGHGGFTGMLLGSVCRAVVQSAPVLVIVAVDGGAGIEASDKRPAGIGLLSLLEPATPDQDVVRYTGHRPIRQRGTVTQPETAAQGQQQNILREVKLFLGAMAVAVISGIIGATAVLAVDPFGNKHADGSAAAEWPTSEAPNYSL
jgi:hypothetical protein